MRHTPGTALQRMYIYLIQRGDDTEQTKVGITRDLQSRLRGYQTASQQRDYRIVRSWETPHARAVERAVLEICGSMGWCSKNTNGEGCRTTVHVLEGLVEDEISRFAETGMRDPNRVAIGDNNPGMIFTNNRPRSYYF